MPSGAHVLLDGDELCSTPCDVLTPTQPGRLVFSRRGYRTVTREVEGLWPQAVTVELEHDESAPSVPVGLQVTDVSAHSVALAWQASTDDRGVAGYRVYRDDVLIASPTGLAYTDMGLIAGTAYSYQVAAYDAAGNESARGEALEVTTDEDEPDSTAPSVPAGLQTTEVTAHSVSLAWQASTDNVGVAGYRVYRGGVLIGSTAGLTYSDTGLESSTTYSCQVAGYDAAGNESAQCAALHVTTEREAPRAPPLPGGAEQERIP